MPNSQHHSRVLVPPHLCNRVKLSRHIEDTFRITGNRFGNGHSSRRLLLRRVSIHAYDVEKFAHPDLIDVSATPSNDDTGVLGDNQASHRDLLSGGFGGFWGCGGHGWQLVGRGVGGRGVAAVV